MTDRPRRCDCGELEDECVCAEPTFWSWWKKLQDDYEATADKPLPGREDGN